MNTFLYRLGGDEPHPPQPPTTPNAPVEEPPDSPQTEPNAPVREPGPAEPKKWGRVFDSGQFNSTTAEDWYQIYLR